MRAVLDGSCGILMRRSGNEGWMRLVDERVLGMAGAVLILRHDWSGSAGRLIALAISFLLDRS